MAGSSAAYLRSRVRKGPITTTSVGPTTASGGVTGRGKTTNPSYGRPKPQYLEREARNVADDKLRAEVLRSLGQAFGPQGPGGAGAAAAATMPRSTPQVPVEPVPGNPYAGVGKAIGRFAQASAARSKGDVAAARASLKGRPDQGAAIAGSFNAQAAGQAAERAAAITALRNQTRAGFAEEELKRRSQGATNRFEARQAQIKNDAELMGGGAGLSLSMVQQLESEGIDSSQYLNNPMMGMIALGRARFARRGEAGLPPTAWAQAAQYGLQPPNSYDNPEQFYWALGQAKSGSYGGGDAATFLQSLAAAGLLKGMP